MKSRNPPIDIRMDLLALKLGSDFLKNIFLRVVFIFQVLSPFLFSYFSEELNRDLLYVFLDGCLCHCL